MNPENPPPSPATRSAPVTVVVTSCARQDLLEITLSSFFAHNTYQPIEIFVIEDGPAGRNRRLAEKFRDRPVTWLSTGRRVGQIRAIDAAYARVTSPYIFHLEDDWEFHASGFIEKSVKVVESRPDCLLVKIQPLDEMNGHPLEERCETVDGISFRRLSSEYRVASNDGPFCWRGFSFNPGLRRTADYHRIGRFAALADSGPGSAARSEEAIGEAYWSMGFYVVALADNDGRGYARHIGSDRHVNPPWPTRIRRKIRRGAQLVVRLIGGSR